MHSRRLPSFFLTQTTGAAYGDVDFAIQPLSSSSCIYSLTSLKSGFGIEEYVLCTGIPSWRVIDICKLGIHPISFSSRAKAPASSQSIFVTTALCSSSRWLRSTLGCQEDGLGLAGVKTALLTVTLGLGMSDWSGEITLSTLWMMPRAVFLSRVIECFVWLPTGEDERRCLHLEHKQVRQTKSNFATGCQLNNVNSPSDLLFLSHIWDVWDPAEDSFVIKSLESQRLPGWDFRRAINKNFVTGSLDWSNMEQNDIELQVITPNGNSRSTYVSVERVS